MRAARARPPPQPGPGDKVRPPVTCLKPQCLVAWNVCSCLVSPLPEAPGPGVLGRLPQGHAGCSLKALGCPPHSGDIPVPVFPGALHPPPLHPAGGCPDPQPCPSVHPACRSAAAWPGLPGSWGFVLLAQAGEQDLLAWGGGGGGCSVYSRGQMGRNPNPASRSLLSAQTNLGSSSSDANSKCERVSCPSRGREGRQHPAQVLRLRDLTVGPPGREGALPLEPCAPACLLGGGMGRAGHSSLHSQPCSSRLQQQDRRGRQVHGVCSCCPQPVSGTFRSPAQGQAAALVPWPGFSSPPPRLCLVVSTQQVFLAS